MQNLRQTFLNLTPRARIALAGALVGVLVLAFVLVRVATSPSYTTLLTGVDPAETSKITAALDERGVPYELQNNGTALAVPKAKTAEARVALAEQGLPGKGSKPGWELFDDQKLGASDFQQKVSYQRALEGEIARTIEGVGGVSGAQVQLVLPEEQLFEDEQSPATAAVLLEGGADALEPSSVRGIAQLVSSSVKGLKSENVSITDSSGQLLWPRDDGSTTESGMASTSGRQAAEERYERGLESRLNALLAGTVGPGKARVQVKAELDARETTRDSLRYGRRAIALEETTEDERLRGAGGNAGGVAGTEGNDGVPSYVQGAAGGDARYDRETATRKNGVNKDVIRTKEPPGAVQRQAVSLVLDESVPPTAVAELRRAVEGAAGIDTTRGDTLAVSQIPFAAAAAEDKPGVAEGLLGYLKYAGLALAMLLFLVFLARHLRRREDATFAEEPTWLREIEAPTPLAQLEQTQMLEEPVAAAPARFERLEPTADPDLDRMRRQVEDLAHRQPDRLAQQVRAWINAD